MAEIRGTETEKNLLKAFAGESQARNRYTMFAKAAIKEGFEQIGAIFLETADNERVHARLFFDYLKGGEPLEITATFPAGRVGTTAENLLAAAAGENEEWTLLYPAFADVAEREGFAAVATTFREVSQVEAWHETRYRRLAARVQEGTVFLRTAPQRWKCRECGYVHEGTEPPKVCPCCKHARAFFEIYAENY
jgi:rubrerythrin